MNILIVDDNRDGADSVAMLLELGGHATRAVYSGADALQAGPQFLPQAALLDISMPGMNGYDLARAIRGTDWGKTVTLVAMTGWGEADDLRMAREAGFDHHVAKPLDFAALQDFFEKLP